MPPRIPNELAEARARREALWTSYLEAVDDTNPALIAERWTVYQMADEETSLWYARWQQVGGTSDIVSIEAEELRQSPDGTHPSPFIYGGEVFDPETSGDDDMPF